MKSALLKLMLKKVRYMNLVWMHVCMYSLHFLLYKEILEYLMDLQLD